MVSLKIFGMIVFFGVLVLASMVYYHELAHKEIYSHYNIQSEMKLDLKKGVAYVMPEEPCPSDACILAHNINDSIGYIFFPFMVFVIIISALLVSEVGS